MKIETKKIVLVGLFAALTYVATSLIQVPSIKGYVHLGDSLVYLSGIILGPIYGALAAGIGSMISDLYLGYSSYAIPTLIIKGLDAFVVGSIYFMLFKDATGIKKTIKYIIAVIFGTAVMVLGYFAYELALYGSEYALPALIPNLSQGLAGGVLAYPLYFALEKTKVFNLK